MALSPLSVLNDLLIAASVDEQMSLDDPGLISTISLIKYISQMNGMILVNLGYLLLNLY